MCLIKLRPAFDHADMLSLYHYCDLARTLTRKTFQGLTLLVYLGSATAFFPRGQLPKEDLRRSPSTTQATRHPRALFQSLFPLPPYFCHECILHPVRTLPCPPVLYIYPIESLVCFFLVFLSYTYIQTPQKRTPQHISNPTNKLC